ncbi:hypothetical protein [Nocardia sp. NPDC049526]|uniref:hypothetical protein n=1 Tax=Nocardia sp. NPDC049526 TaxID=3364316 RepID=UPI00379E5089
MGSAHGRDLVDRGRVRRRRVQAPICDEFVDRVVSNVRALWLGVDGPDIGAELGAMTYTAQVEPVMRT